MATDAQTESLQTENADDAFWIGKHVFKNRLIVGTGKYETFDLMREALDVSRTE